MNAKLSILCVALATSSLAAKCGGGGGGGWLVGTEGLMVNVTETGDLGAGYELGNTEQLNAIACRNVVEAWVVGNAGTVLYTSDGGDSWSSQNLGTTANLRALATKDAGSVFIAGDGVFFTGTGTADWKQLGDGATSFRSLAAAQRGATVLALSDDGGLWSYANETLTKVTTLAGMRSVAVSLDGQRAVAVGDGIFQSVDAGRTWQSIAVDPSFAYEDVGIDLNGEAVAVGAAGVVSRIDVEGRVLTQRVGTDDLKALHVAPSNDYTGRGYASGVGGQVWVTEDSGWTWTMGPNVGRTVLGADEIGLGHN